MFVCTRCGFMGTDSLDFGRAWWTEEHRNREMPAICNRSIRPQDRQPPLMRHQYGELGCGGYIFACRTPEEWEATMALFLKLGG